MTGSGFDFHFKANTKSVLFEMWPFHGRISILNKTFNLKLPTQIINIITSDIL